MAERIDIVVSERGSRTVRRNIAGIGKTATKTQGAVKLLSRTLGFLALGAGITAGIRTLASFSQEMSTVKAVANATGAEFEALTAKARDLGATTRFTATQAAEGMTFLARAGFDAGEVLETVGDTLLLAQAGALDLGRAADIASNILKGFGLANAEAGRVVDVLANTANSANTNVDQLGEAMKFAAPVARGFGVDIEEAAAAVGVLGDAGLQGTIAGTGLRTTILKLADPTSKARKTLAALGLTQADVNVETLGLTQVLKNLEGANISTSQAFALVGLRAGTALSVLIKNIPAVEKLTEANREAAGEAQRVADIMDDNLNGALLRVKSAFEAIVLSVGAAGATGALRSFFESLATGLRTVAANVDVLVNAFEFTAMIAGLFAVIKVVKILGIAIATNPIGLIATAIALAVVGLVAFRDQLSKSVGSVGELGDTVNALIGLFKDFGSAVLDALQLIFPGLADFRGEFVETAEGINTFVFNTVDRIDFLRASFIGAVAAIIAAWEGLPDAFSKIAANALNFAIEKVESGVRKIINLINLIPGIDAGFEGFGRVGGGGEVDLGEDALTAGALAFGGARGTLTDRLVELKDVAKATRELASLDRQAAAEAQEMDEVNTDLSKTLKMATTDLEDAGDATKKLGDDSEGAAGKVKKLKDVVEEEVTFIADAFESAFSKAGDALADFITTGKVDFKSLINSILSDITKLAISNLQGGLFGGGGKSGGGLLGGLFGGGGGLGGLFGGIGKLFGFQHGGGFQVAGLPGSDNNIMSINGDPVGRVSRGEQVTITPRGDSGARPVQVIMNIQTPDAESFRRSEGQIIARAQAALSRQGRRNN